MFRAPWCSVQSPGSSGPTCINPDRALCFDERTHAVHLWNELWRRGGFDKDDDYDPGCLYQRLQTPHLPADHARQTAGSAPSPADPSLPRLRRPGSAIRRRCPRSARSSCPRTARTACPVASSPSAGPDSPTKSWSASMPRPPTTPSPWRGASRPRSTWWQRPAISNRLSSESPHSAPAISFCASTTTSRFGGHWDKAAFQLLVRFNNLSHLWVPRRWLVPGDAFITDAPWFPDPQLRLYANDRARLTWPTEVHEQFAVTGRSLVLFDRWLDHHVLIDRPRGERRRRCEEYRRLNPRVDRSTFYLVRGPRLRLPSVQHRRRRCGPPDSDPEPGDRPSTSGRLAARFHDRGHRGRVCRQRLGAARILGDVDGGPARRDQHPARRAARTRRGAGCQRGSLSPARLSHPVSHGPVPRHRDWRMVLRPRGADDLQRPHPCRPGRRRSQRLVHVRGARRPVPCAGG